MREYGDGCGRVCKLMLEPLEVEMNDNGRGKGAHEPWPVSETRVDSASFTRAVKELSNYRR